MWKSLLEKDTGRRGSEPASFPQMLAELQRLRASQGIFVVILLRGEARVGDCCSWLGTSVIEHQAEQSEVTYKAVLYHLDISP